MGSFRSLSTPGILRWRLRAVLRGSAAEPGRTVLSIGAISAAVALVLLFEGFEEGIYRQLREVAERLPAPLVVVQEGVTRFGSEQSSLPPLTRAAVEAVPGVASAHPMAGIPLIYERGGLRTPVYAVAYDTLGAPHTLAAGRQIRAPMEIVLDTSLAAKYGFAVGDELEVLDFSFTIVGLSTGTAALFTPFVFTRYVDWVDIYFSGALDEESFETSLLSFLLVELEPAADAGAVRVGIEKTVAGADVRTPAELAEANVVTGRQLLGPVLGLLVGIAYGITLLVVGLTVYAATANRLRELAVERALGASLPRLVSDLTVETFFVTTVALVIGVTLASVSAALVELAAPELRVLPTGGTTIARTAIGVFAVAGLGSLAPVRRIAALDPASAFAA